MVSGDTLGGRGPVELDFHKDPSILSDIVDAMAVGVFTVDSEGRFVTWLADHFTSRVTRNTFWKSIIISKGEYIAINDKVRSLNYTT